MDTEKTRKPDAPPNWREVFLRAYARYGVIGTACRAARVSRGNVEYHRKQDTDFLQQFEDARNEALDTLEKEAWRRAKSGTVRPVFHNGEMCGGIREYSDTLLIFLLKHQRPVIYNRPQVLEHQGPGGGPIPIREIVVNRAEPEEPNGGNLEP